MGKKIKKISISLLVLIEILSFNYAYAEVVDVGNMPTAGDVFSDFMPSALESMEERYHINSDSLQEFGEQMNVSTRKADTPQVMIFFNPSNPKPGEEVVAKALPMYFSNNKESLFYTWYLKRDIEGEENGGNKDYNQDGDINMEDYKIAASKIYARGSYDGRNTGGSKDGNKDGYDVENKFGGDNVKKPQSGSSCYVNDFESGETYEINKRNSNGDFVKNCQHIFPNAPNRKTGDGEFKETEENFWGTNNRDPDTANSGNVDEANVAGVGAVEFTWNYYPGDKIGVAVEGLSMVSTKYNDSSKKVMWALPNNDFSCIDDASKSQKVVEIEGYDVDIPVVSSFDLNDCLKDNFIDPIEGGQPKTLDPMLSYSPSDPYNDSSGDNTGDRIIVNAITNNSSNNDSSQIYYNWEVEASNSLAVSNNDWKSITSSLYSLPEEEINPTPSQGTGLTEFGFNLNINKEDHYSVYKKIFQNENKAFLRFTVEVEEHVSGNITKKGEANIIVKVTTGEESIKVFKPEIIDNEKVTEGGEICTRDLDKEVCFVAQNEIIGLKIDNNNLENFSWKLNGKPLNCNSDVSSLCSDNKSTNYNFFPIDGDIGDVYNLTLAANNIKEGRSVYVRRKFQIVDPFIEISIPSSLGGSNQIQRKKLGEYIDIENTGASEEDLIDYSDGVFETFPGAKVGLVARFHPGFIAREDRVKCNLIWSINGVEVESPIQDCSNLENLPEEYLDENTGVLLKKTDEGGYYQIEFPVEKNKGEVYNISVQSSYNQNIETRKALYAIWKIGQQRSVEVPLKEGIQVEITSPDEIAMEKNKNVLANLFSNLPGQAMFLLRVILTVFMVILTTSLIFSFSFRPKR